MILIYTDLHLKPRYTEQDISKFEMNHLLNYIQPTYQQVVNADLIVFVQGPYCKVIKNRWGDNNVILNLMAVKGLVETVLLNEYANKKVGENAGS